MISDPIYSSFRFYFPMGWITDDVRNKFMPYINVTDLPFRHIEDYINHTVINAKLPGLSDPLTSPQSTRVNGEANRTQVFQTASSPKELLTKELSISFNLKNSYLNWLILYQQFISHLDRINEQQVFMKNVYLQIFDDEDNIIIELIYKNISIKSLSDVDFRKQDSGLISREFDMVLAFNDFELKLNTDKTQSNRDSSKHEY